MFCTNCGKEIPDDATFCPFCGQTIEDAAVPVRPSPVPSPPQEGYVATTGSRAGKGRRPVVIVVAVACVVVVAAIVAYALTRGGEATDQGDAGGISSAPVDAGVSTPIGNLVNGGYVCEDDDNVYYARPVRGASGWYTNGIVRASKAGSDTQVIYEIDDAEAVIYHLNVESDRVIFSEVRGSGTTVRSVGTDGSNPVALAVADDSSLVQVYAGRVYYLSGGTVKVMDPDGGNQSDVLSVGDRLWRVGEGGIVSFDSKGVYLAGLDGTGQRTLLTTSQMVGSGDITNVIPRSDGSYEVFCGQADEGGAYRIDVYDKDGNYVRTDAEANDGYHINRANPTDAGTIVMMDRADSDDESLGLESSGSHQDLYSTSDAAASLCFPTSVDGYVYFGYVCEGNNRLMRVPLSGGSAEVVS